MQIDEEVKRKFMARIHELVRQERWILAEWLGPVPEHVDREKYYTICLLAKMSGLFDEAHT